ncbi:hypothetical protein LMG6871_02157 [Ralstonia edaphis]|uniref:FmdB family zinc ribbon protein n=1 Tax=Ralstonia edaphi TaxID=3058599 RepID=UPI0028F65F29|nr:zinc ribbon domain-containing protein [Ralstonia sp. LMG 6871]CAJ0717537.1 hypothetical protein LMG6871_02157 [Ralstonia sp. LMG 6871]
MPLYDIRCTACDGIFERLIPAAKLLAPTPCPYCDEDTPAAPMPTGGRVALKSVSRWQPSSLHEQLAGKPITGPGSAGGSGRRNSVLHVCGGKHCSICGV